MKPIIYSPGERDFTTNGYGRVSPLRCIVTEERNGQFELQMDVSVTDKRFSSLREGMLLFAPHDDTKTCEPFEIYRMDRPINGIVTVYAWHVSYRTAKMVVSPFRATSCNEFMAQVGNHIVGDNPFTFATDMTTTGEIKVEKPETLRSRLGGSEDSLLDKFGGEFEWNRFNVYLRSQRGSETNVTLRYGKNITDLKKTTDSTDVWTGVCPYWYGTDPDSSSEELVTLSEGAVYSSYSGRYDYRMVIPVDFTQDFESKPSESELRARAQEYVRTQAPSGGIPSSIDVSFVQLWNTLEYQNVAALERLRLCDTLTIVHEKLGVSNTAKIVKTVYDVLLERYESMTIGEVRTSLGDVIRAAAQDIKKTAVNKTAMQKAIEAATKLIRGGLGGHVVFNTDADGHPNEILIMDTDDIATAVKVLRINLNGIGFSSSGYNGPFKSAWTLDGAFVADFITAGTLNAAIIKAGILMDETGTNYWNMETGEFKLAATTKVGASTIASQSDIGVLDNSFTQSKVFNRLTNNGQTQGIYLENGYLYINASYIATGILADINQNVVFNLSTGTLTMKKGSINIGSGKFVVNTSGDLTANSATIKGTVKSGSDSGYWIYLDTAGKINGGSGSTTYGYINFSAALMDNSASVLRHGIELSGGAINVLANVLAVGSSPNATSLSICGSGYLSYVDGSTGASTRIRFLNGLMVTDLS